jgi:hypothetical protein
MRKLIRTVLVIAAAVLASGMAPAASSAPPIRFTKPVVALDHCGSGASTLGVPGSSASFCYEPTVAVDRRGRIFVTDAYGDAIAVSSDGGRHFVRKPPPPPPAGDAVITGDAIVQIDPRGRLVFSNIFATGIQVAVSSTGGRSWDSNVLVGIGPATYAPVPDRQWVGFGARGEIYVVWRDPLTPAVWSATSRDGGRTFGDPAPFLLESSAPTVLGPLWPGVGTADVLTMGPPVTDRDGVVYIPLILGDLVVGPYATAVAVSRSGVDAGTFVVNVVSADAGDFFPVAAVAPNGRVAIAWREYSRFGHVTGVSYSDDHGLNWSRPAVWGSDRDATSSPWIGFRGAGQLDVLSFGVVYPAAEAEMVLARGSAGRLRQRTVVTNVRSNSTTGRSEANTDYAHFARMPDGRLITVWCDTAVYVAIERPGR